MASNHDRQCDEITVLIAMFGEHLFDVETEEGGVSFALRTAGEFEAMLRVRLPPAYPEEPPHLELSCPGAAANALLQARTELCSLAAATTCERRREDGEECGAILAQRFLELAADALKPPPPAAATAASAASAADELEEALVAIDHMNDHEVQYRHGRTIPAKATTYYGTGYVPRW